MQINYLNQRKCLLKRFAPWHIQPGILTVETLVFSKAQTIFTIMHQPFCHKLRFTCTVSEKLYVTYNFHSEDELNSVILKQSIN